MQSELTEILAALDRGRTAIDTLLGQASPSGQRAVRVAELLRSLRPAAPLAACALWEDGHWQAVVLDQAGGPRPDQADALRGELARQRGTGPMSAARLAQALGWPDQRLASAEVAGRAALLGVLALAVPAGAAPEVEAGAQALLASCARHLALRLELEALERERDNLREELAALAGMARVGEVTGPMVHEVNNFLNVCQLHVAVLEAEVPEGLRADLTEIRRQGAALTALIKQLQKYRQRQQAGLQPVDLNAAVRAAVDALRRAPVPGRHGERGAPAVHLQLAPDLPPVPGSFADLKRLADFLLANAAAAGGDRLTVRTEAAAGKVVLRVEDSGPAIAPELLPRLFEPEVVGRPGTEALELAACKGLVRRLQGKILGENRPGGGVAVIVELTAKQT
jgi:two-component system, NtrC family, C4-dicarboxylate transport sensor histidine kinase DctB